MKKSCTVLVALWTVTPQEAHEAVTEVTSTPSAVSAKVSSRLLRDCVFQTALESSLCENAASWRRVSSLIF